MMTEGQEESSGVKDLLVIFIMVLMSQLYLRQNLESGILKYVQCIVLYCISFMPQLKTMSTALRRAYNQLLQGSQQHRAKSDPAATTQEPL